MVYKIFLLLLRIIVKKEKQQTKKSFNMLEFKLEKSNIMCILVLYALFFYKLAKDIDLKNNIK